MAFLSTSSIGRRCFSSAADNADGTIQFKISPAAALE